MSTPSSLQTAATPADHKRSHTAIWLAFAFALLLHIFFILMPLIKQVEPPRTASTRIEIQVQRYPPPPASDEPVEERAAAARLPAQNLPLQPAKKATAETKATSKNILKSAASATPSQTSRQLAPTLEQQQEISQQRLQNLSPQILSSQFIREKSTTENIFGPALHRDPQPVQKEFHFPHKPNMITMLDKPVSGLPFAYTPGLIEFSYDPGVKGNLQRFWDKITPEFGWRTNYGTKVKCKWVLVIAACGWGRSDD